MKFLVFYMEMGLEAEHRDRQAQNILNVLTPAIEAGLLEDIVFVDSYKKRNCQVIDLGSGSSDDTGDIFYKINDLAFKDKKE